MSGCKNKFLARVEDGLTRRYYALFKKNLVFSNTNFKVLMFHDIDGHDEYSVSKNDFTLIINALISKGCGFIDIDTLSNCKNIKELNNKVLITFDDGFSSTFSFAYPFLKEKNIPFCVFVTISLIDQSGYLKSEEVKELSNSGICTIGSHFFNHVMSRFLDSKTVFEEANNSFEYLKNNFGVDKKYIALPYGSFYSCSRKDLKIIKKTNPLCIFTTKPTFVKKFKRFNIPRIDGSKILINEKI